MPRVTQWPVFACIAALLMQLGACQSHQQPQPVGPLQGSTQTFDTNEQDVDWPFWPASMRIHPLTRVLANDEQIIIEARIEFSDAHGSTTRCKGQLRLLLIETAGASEGQVLEEWNNDLREIDNNVLHFDDITRTYLFRLRLDPANYSRTAELHAQFLSADNRRLSAAYRIGSR